MRSFCDLARSFLQEDDIDNTIIDYLANVARDVEDTTMSLDDYVDLVLLMATDSKLQTVGRHAVANSFGDLLDQAKRNNVNEVDRTQVLDADAAVNQSGPEWLSDLLDQSRLQDKGEHASGSSDAQQQICPNVQQLSDIAGNCLTDEYLVHILQQKGGHMQAAATWLIEQEDLKGLEAAWLAGRERNHITASTKIKSDGREEQRVKQLIVDRFAFAEEKQRSKRGSAALPWGHKTEATRDTPAQIRYRDGMKVSSRGEKHVLISEPEWDGGSRGKVFTKGKRGKGFT